MEQVDVGEVLPITTNWWDDPGGAVEPDQIELTVTRPDGTVLLVDKAAMIQGATVDVWSYPMVIGQLGVWLVHAVGTVGFDQVVQDSAFLAGDGSGTGGPCDLWCTWDEVLLCGTDPAPTIDSGTRNQVLEKSSEILFNLSDRTYPGICTATRSLCQACASCHPAPCSCSLRPAVDLGGRYPVWGAYDVVVDGVTLPRSAYAVRDHRWLVRLDDEMWPPGADMADPNAFRASWAYGRNPPTGGRRAAADFSFQLAKMCAGDKTCQLPQRVTSVVREGITYTILDSMKMIEEGRTGLPLVDLWIISDRLGRRPRARSFSPLMAGTRRRVS